MVVPLLLLVGSCVAVLASHGESSAPTVQESSAPTVQESQPEASASDEPTTDNSTEEPTKEPTEEPSPYRQGKLAKAAEQKFTYPDGQEIHAIDKIISDILSNPKSKDAHVYVAGYPKLFGNRTETFLRRTTNSALVCRTKPAR